MHTVFYGVHILFWSTLHNSNELVAWYDGLRTGCSDFAVESMGKGKTAKKAWMSIRKLQGG